MPPALQWAGSERFTATVAVDGSTLNALMRKTGLLRDDQGGVLPQLTDAGVWFLKRKEARTATHTERAPCCIDVIRDAMVRLGYV